MAVAIFMILEMVPRSRRKKLSYPMRNYIVCLLVTLLKLGGTFEAPCEEAMERNGQQHRGQLIQEQGKWFFRSESSRTIPVQDLSTIHFQARPGRLPKVNVTKTLLLPGDQRIKGSLTRIDEKSIEFATSLGHVCILRRELVVGIEQVDRWQAMTWDDIEDPLKRWKDPGKIVLDSKQTLFGKASLRFEKAEKGVRREWLPQSQDHRIRLYFRSMLKEAPVRWSVELLLQGDRAAANPTLVIDRKNIRCIHVKENLGYLETTSDWHGLFIELQANALRFYVDDRCLGQTFLEHENAIRGMRVHEVPEDAYTPVKNSTDTLWMEGLIVERALPVLPMPPREAVQDWLWLLQGEQLLGRIISADDRVVILQGKFGKHTLEWTRLRGIGFAESRTLSVPNEVEIRFRPAAGFSFDTLRARLLRWEPLKLWVEHKLLGELAIERDRLESIRFEVK